MEENLDSILHICFVDGLHLPFLGVRIILVLHFHSVLLIMIKLFLYDIESWIVVPVHSAKYDKHLLF